MTAQIDTLNLFNCVLNQGHKLTGSVFTGLLDIGVVLDFIPTDEQIAMFREELNPLNITTLFTREERENADISYLLEKQILHYIEVYGLGTPGLFDLTTTDGTLFSLRYVQGITVGYLGDMIRKLLYANAPIKDTALVKRIIRNYAIDYTLSKVQNHEMRCSLFNPGWDKFENGDDAVRYICYQATGDALLIKSKEVIAAVSKITWTTAFFIKHEHTLAQVFNRHKRLILATKGPLNKTVINRIARLSKTQHVPIQESIAKTFVHGALVGPRNPVMDVLSKISVRDKFKYLNLLSQKRLQSPVSSFKIRNGKVYTRLDRPVYDLQDIGRVEGAVLLSIGDDLAHLKSGVVLLDKNVDYGLPVSRKQTVGNLPFGTQIVSNNDEISSGMYWENEWGARDLDLSTIDMEGNRVGWGQYSGYTDRSVIFSGDVTDARKGAMEFMTSRDKEYGLFVNIFAGEPGAQMELVIGTRDTTKHRWMDSVLVREKHTLNSRNSVIGFVRGKTFTVYAGRLSNSRVSKVNPILNESRADLWTVKRLFITLGIDFAVDNYAGIEYTHDLSYPSFSFNKLENVFEAT